MVTTVGLYKYLLQKSEAFELAKSTNVMNVKIQKALLSGKYSNYEAARNEIIIRLFLRFDGMISVDSRQMPSSMKA